MVDNSERTRLSGEMTDLARRRAAEAVGKEFARVIAAEFNLDLATVENIVVRYVDRYLADQAANGGGHLGLN
jgi:hypothetical protein